MNTLTNNDLENWATSPEFTGTGVQELASRLLAAEVEVTSLKRERETMHSIEYVQGVLARTAELEAQLAELQAIVNTPIKLPTVDDIDYLDEQYSGLAVECHLGRILLINAVRTALKAHGLKVDE